MEKNITHKKRKVYSFSLKKSDNDKIKEFIKNQSNFSETVRYLMYIYLMENGTNDISFKFNDLMFSHIAASNNRESIEKIEKKSIEDEVVVGIEKKEFNTDTIPDCYK